MSTNANAFVEVREADWAAGWTEEERLAREGPEVVVAAVWAANSGDSVLPVATGIEGRGGGNNQRQAKLPEVGRVLLLVGSRKGGEALMKETLEVAGAMGLVDGCGRGGCRLGRSSEG